MLNADARKPNRIAPGLQPVTTAAVTALLRHRAAVAVFFFTAGLALRLPNLLVVPRFEDEGLEVLWAFDISQGDRLPLTGYDAYYGPLYSYLLAGVFWLLGPDILWPRLLVAVFGALTVSATYMLGRLVAGERVGVVAGLVTLTSPTLVVVTSHLGWSNSLTPFFATTTMAAFHVGTTRNSPAFLLLGGVLAGLTLQTHALSAALIAALALWSLTYAPMSGKRFMGLTAALSGVLVGYLPMLWNFIARWGDVTMEIEQQSYAFAPPVSVADYLSRVWLLPWALSGFVAGVRERLWLGFTDVAVLSFYLMQGLGVAVIIGLALASREFFARQGGRCRFLALILALPVLMLPMVTASYQSRYLAFMLPPAFICIAVAFVRGWDLAVRRWKTYGTRAPVLAMAVSLAAVLLLDVYGIVRIRGASEDAGISNVPFMELSERVEASEHCRNGILVQNTDELGPEGTDGAWAHFNIQSVRLILTMNSCLFTMESEYLLDDRLRNRTSETWIIVSQGLVPELSREFQLTPILELAPGPAIAPEYRLTLFEVAPHQ